MASSFSGRASALVLVAALVLAAAGCTEDAKAGGADADDPTPEEVLALAKTTLDETPGVTISLSTDEVPSGVTGIKSATGLGAHPAAFEGEFELSVNGLPATAEVIAVDGVTYAKNSLLLPDWTQIDPDDYGAPDPATLMEPDGGFSGLISALTDVEEGDSVRGGQDNREIFTEYTGTIPSTAVEALIPTASGDFEATLTISEDGELRRAELSGVFYDEADELTYTLTLDDYGTEAEITAP
ncbi:LppX_LprAFG lipoprotein [Nocardioides dilutus]